MAIDVTVSGLNTVVDVEFAESPSDIPPETYIALRGEKGDTGSPGAPGQDGTDGVDGADGFSPIATVSKVGDTATISITDLNGTTTATVTDGADGQDGRDGVDGQDGADGQDGYSPTATVTKSGDTATITITDINGTTTATVKDGTQANVFVAEFNVTPYADVKDAYDNGAIIICTADDSGNTMIFQLAYYDDTDGVFYFAEPNGDGWALASIGSDDTWDEGHFLFASTDVATQLADGLMSALDKQKLDNIASGAEVNVQSDWNQSVNTADDYIKNKPTIPTKVSDLSNDSGYITSPNVVYCTCSTAGGTAAKVATIESGSLTSLNEGDQAIVKFTNANSVASPTLQVGTTTAKSIKRYGTTAPSTSAATSWNAGSAILFVYDGTYWQQIGFLNTTYSEISQANITNGSGSSTGLVTGRRAKAAVEAFAPIKDVTVDGTSVLSGTTAAIDLSGKANASHTHTKSEITDFPTLAAVATTGNYNSLTDKPAIHNVPSGGSSGQVLSKASGTDYDLAWVNQSGGGGSVTDVEVNGTSVVTGGVAEVTVPTDTGDLTNGAGFITGYTETDPVFTASDAYGISSSDISNWNGKLDASGVLNLFYPVGSYYETSDTTFDPNISWGGTWSLETEGQVHISAGTNYAVAGALTNTTDGGEKTHTLTKGELPTDKLNLDHGAGGYNGNSSVFGFTSITVWNSIQYSQALGSGQAHNNMQPYIIVNRWHRTA